MSFSSSTGQLSGTPGSQDVGIYPNIRISVSDGEFTAQLPAFDLTVTAPQPVTGSATLSWTPPTQRMDGSALTSISGYKLYYGRNADNLEQIINAGSGVTSYFIDNLEQGTWYFAVSALDGAGTEGATTATVSKIIP